MRYPDATKRTVVLGRTGSGKTVFSVALLAKQNWNEMPWVIIDYKGDELIGKLQDHFPKHVREHDVSKAPPSKPGLHIVRPIPDRDDDALEAFLWAMWEQQNNGLFKDEGYMIPTKSVAMKAILTQGRSRRVPVIALYQRPVYMNRFAVAQADFFAVFDQNDERDLQTTAQFVKPATMPDGSKVTVFSELPRYWSLWYDVGEGQTTVLRPAPPEPEILEAFARRMPRQRSKGVFV